MLENLMEPAVLCFLAGILAGLLRSDLRFPPALYETMSVYLLLAIGFKGGTQLAKTSLATLILPIACAVALGLLIPLVAFAILRYLGRLDRPDAAAISAHYGSVSAVTFAVVLGYLSRLSVSHEDYVAVLLAVMEIPAIAVGVVLARSGQALQRINWKQLLHEVFLGRSVYLLITGMLIGWIAGPQKMEFIKPLFVDLFKGVLTLFLLEMGLTASQRLADLRKVGVFLVLFGIGMPVLSACLGTLIGYGSGLSVGGMVVLTTLAASASYIAAPAAMRVAVPEANPTLYLTAALGITFPFNISIGIPLYHWMVERAVTT